MPDVKTFVIDGTSISVKDETARTNASSALSTANSAQSTANTALSKATYIESLDRLVVSYTAGTETITFTREDHEEDE